MKKAAPLLLIMLTALCTSGQISISASYLNNRPAFQSNIVDYFEDPGTNSIDQANTPYTFGTGHWVNAVIGYNITPCFSAEIGATYQLSKNKFEQIRATEAPPSESRTTYTNTSIVILTPSIKYTCSKKKLKPFGRIGVLLPLNGDIDVEQEARGNDPIQMENYDYKRTASIQLERNLGIQCGLGASYPITPKLSIFAEASARILNLKMASQGVTSQFDNLTGTENLDQLAVNEREFIYADQISTRDNDPNQPGVLLQQAQPYSGFGFGAGVTYTIGNTKPALDRLNKINNSTATFDPNGPCKPENVKKLLHDLAIPITLIIADTTNRKMKMKMTPVLQRGKVPAGWGKLTTAFINVINAYKMGARSYGTYKNVRDKEYLAAAHKSVPWIQNATGIGFDFIPEEMGGDYTGSALNIATFYLKALRSAARGMGGLGSKIGDMRVNFEWELPIVRIEGECIPRLICRNGKWRPDYFNTTFVIVKKEEDYQRYGKEKYGYKSFTLRQAAQANENIIIPFLEQCGRNKRDLEANSACQQKNYEIGKIKYPVMSDDCKKQKKRKAFHEAELQKLNQELTTLQEDITNWSKKGRKDQIKKVKDDINLMQQETDALNDKIKKNKKAQEKAKQMMSNYKKNGLKNSDKYKKKDKELKDLQDVLVGISIRLIELSKLKELSNNELTDLGNPNDKNPQDSKTKEINHRMNQLKSDIKKHEKEIEIANSMILLDCK